MRRAVVWSGLVATVAMSIWLAATSSDSASDAVELAPRRPHHPEMVDIPVVTTVSMPVRVEQLRPALPPALRDVFAIQARQVSANRLQPLTTMAVAPPAVLEPVLDVAYLGRFTAPDGRVSVYLSHAGQDIEAKVGDTLDNGFLIETVSDDRLRLVYPQSNKHVEILLSDDSQ